MVTYQAPGVYVEEVPLTPSIAGVGTSTAGFIGVSDGDGAHARPAGRHSLPDRRDQRTGAGHQLRPVQTLVRRFRSAGTTYWRTRVYGFFNNGGSACWVARVADIGDAGEVRNVLRQFAAIDEIALVAAPGARRTRAVKRHRALRRREPEGPVRHPRRPADPTITEAAIKGAVSTRASTLRRSLLPLVKVFDPVTRDNIVHPAERAGRRHLRPRRRRPAACTRLRPTRGCAAR